MRALGHPSLLLLMALIIALGPASGKPAFGETNSVAQAKRHCTSGSSHVRARPAKSSQGKGKHRRTAHCLPRKRPRQLDEEGPQKVWAPVGALPLSDAEAARLVVHRPEQRAKNALANRFVPSDSELAAFHAEATGFSPLSVYVDGRDGLTNPSTDELIQWGSLKWGIPTDWLRAEYAEESDWEQAILGNRTQVPVEWWSLYPPVAQLANNEVYETMGITGVKWTPGPNGINLGTEPLRWESTAFNIDYQASIVRYYYSDCSSCQHWLGYAPGQKWNSIGAWAEPYPWINSEAASYIEKVQAILAIRPWATDPSF